MNASDVTFALALEDYVPVILTGIAVLLLARWTPVRRPLALLGALLILAGGLAKASWKLIAVGFGHDIHVLAEALFPCLSTGFVLLSWALLAAAGRRIPWPIPAAVIAVTLGASAALWATWPALITTILGATALAVALVLLARPHRDRLAITAALVWIAGQYTLGPLAAKAGQTLTLQWIEQICNSVAQAALLYAAWRVTRTRTSSLETVA
jgi:hypothetical protein